MFSHRTEPATAARGYRGGPHTHEVEQWRTQKGSCCVMLFTWSWKMGNTKLLEVRLTPAFRRACGGSGREHWGSTSHSFMPTNPNQSGLVSQLYSNLAVSTWCWDTTLHGSVEFLHILWAEALTLFWTIFSRMIPQWTALEDRKSVSLWSKEQACSLSSTIKIILFLRAKGRHADCLL